MHPYPYLYEKALVERRRDLEHEAEQRQLLVRLPRPRSLSRQVAHDLGVLLVKLGMWLKQRGEAAEG